MADVNIISIKRLKMQGKLTNSATNTTNFIAMFFLAKQKIMILHVEEH